MSDFHVLQSERLIFSVPEAKDIPRILEYTENPTISRNLLTFPHPYYERDAIAWINTANQGHQSGEQYIFAIRDKNDGALIGGTGLHLDKRDNRAEIGYWLGEPHWGKGYATESTQTMIGFGFGTLGLNRITASYVKYNPASGKVMQKCGMVEEGTFPEHILKDEAYHDLIMYGITRSQFESR